MNRLLITGGSSYLGQHLVSLASNFDLRYTFFHNDPLAARNGVRLDVRDEEAVGKLISTFKPEAIIHLAGSNRSADMENVIIQGTANVVNGANQTGVRVIHMSTDVIFDGHEPPYSEEDEPTPIHAYGQAKAEAESIISQYADHVIIRTSLIYGLSILDLGTQWMIEALQQRKPATLFTDQIRQPVWAETLSLACLELVSSDFRGVLNVAGGQVLSRADFGVKMLDWWGVEERDSLRFGPSGPQWPLDTRLDLSLAKSVLTTQLPGVDQVIELHRNKKGFGV